MIIFLYVRFIFIYCIFLFVSTFTAEENKLSCNNVDLYLIPATIFDQAKDIKPYSDMISLEESGTRDINPIVLGKQYKDYKAALTRIYKLVNSKITSSFNKIPELSKNLFIKFFESFDNKLPLEIRTYVGQLCPLHDKCLLLTLSALTKGLREIVDNNLIKKIYYGEQSYQIFQKLSLRRIVTSSDFRLEKLKMVEGINYVNWFQCPDESLEALRIQTKFFDVAEKDQKGTDDLCQVLTDAFGIEISFCIHDIVFCNIIKRIILKNNLYPEAEFLNNIKKIYGDKRAKNILENFDEYDLKTYNIIRFCQKNPDNLPLDKYIIDFYTNTEKLTYFKHKFALVKLLGGKYAEDYFVSWIRNISGRFQYDDVGNIVSIPSEYCKILLDTLVNNSLPLPIFSYYSDTETVYDLVKKIHNCVKDNYEEKYFYLKNKKSRPDHKTFPIAILYNFLSYSPFYLIKQAEYFLEKYIDDVAEIALCDVLSSNRCRIEGDWRACIPFYSLNNLLFAAGISKNLYQKIRDQSVKKYFLLPENTYQQYTKFFVRSYKFSKKECNKRMTYFLMTDNHEVLLSLLDHLFAKKKYFKFLAQLEGWLFIFNITNSFEYDFLIKSKALNALLYNQKYTSVPCIETYLKTAKKKVRNKKFTGDKSAIPLSDVYGRYYVKSV